MAKKKKVFALKSISHDMFLRLGSVCIIFCIIALNIDKKQNLKKVCHIQLLILIMISRNFSAEENQYICLSHDFYKQP